MSLILVAVALLSFGRFGPAGLAAGRETAAPAAEGPRARLDRAAALLQRNANAQALALLEPMPAEAAVADDPELLLEAHHHLGWAYLQHSDYARSLDHYGRALGLSREPPSPKFEARALRGMGLVFKNQGDYGQALSHSERAIAVFDSLGDAEGAGRSWITIGNVQDLMGEYRAALSSYQRAKELLEHANAKGQAYFRLFNEIGITYKNLGSYEDALGSYAQGLAEMQRGSDKYGQAMTLSNMGVAYRWLGQDQRAIDHYERSLAICREIDERRGQSFLLGNLAESWHNLGEHRRALDAWRQQLELAREIGNRLAEGLALGSLGDALLYLDRVSEARVSFEQALAIYRTMMARARVSSTLTSLAEIAVREGRGADARRLAEEALALALETESPELEWAARLALARAGRAAGETEGALSHLRLAVEIINGVRGRVLTDTGKIGYLELRQAVFHEMVDALVAAGRPAEALEAAEAARGRAFADLLAARQVALRASDAVPLRSLRDAEARLRAQARSTAAGEPRQADLSRKRAVAAEADLEARLRSLAGEQRELASMVVAEPVSFEDVVGTARRLDATLVEYLVTADRLFVWVVSPTGGIHGAVVPVRRDHLRQKVHDLLKTMNEVDLAALRDPGSARAPLAELYRWTVAPVARHLPADPARLVYFVPHDALLLVPFVALVDERGRSLVERYALGSAPSIGVLRYTVEKKRRVASPARPHLLAVADPRVPDDAGVDGLPGARAEVRRIGDRFPAARRTVLLAEKASEANAKRLGPGQTFLHFAVHGLVRDDRPWDSALVLAAGEGEDGWLKAAEAFALDLRADLVVLSGCSTGLGRLTGDGVLGLARAFIYAGTASVLVSQWDVSDRSTAYLMDRFYGGLRAGRGKADALRAAQLATRARFPHPALWAAFVLIGEPR